MLIELLSYQPHQWFNWNYLTITGHKKHFFPICLFILGSGLHSFDVTQNKLGNDSSLERRGLEVPHDDIKHTYLVVLTLWGPLSCRQRGQWWAHAGRKSLCRWIWQRRGKPHLAKPRKWGQMHAAQVSVIVMEKKTIITWNGYCSGLSKLLPMLTTSTLASYFWLGDWGSGSAAGSHRRCLLSFKKLTWETIIKCLSSFSFNVFFPLTARMQCVLCE